MRLPDPIVDALWTEAMASLGYAIVRSRTDAYIHFDGERLVIATDDSLDVEDSLAQLIFHELCHHLVEGPASAKLVDWGLENRWSSSKEVVREQACLRLQAHLSSLAGLRSFMCPTHAPSRRYYLALPERPLGGRSDFVHRRSVRLAGYVFERRKRCGWTSAVLDVVGTCLEGTRARLRLARPALLGNQIVVR